MTRRVTAIPGRFPWQRRLDCVIRGIDPETLVKFERRPKRIVAVMGRRAGKSVACSLTCGEYALEHKGSRVFWGAHTQDGCAIGHEIFHGPLVTQAGGERHEFGMFGGLVKNKRIQPLQSTLYGGGRVYWRSMEGKGSAIGRGWGIAVVDEFDRVDPEVIKQDVIPATADTGGPVVGITTPLSRGLGREWFLKAQDGNPLYYAINGPTTQNPSPAVREWVEEFAADVGEEDPLYRQEILAEYVEGQGRVFRNVKTNATLGGWREGPVQSGVYTIGADLGEHRDYFVLCALEAQTGEVHGFFRARRIPWGEQARIIKEFWERWGRGPVWIDATGVGDPVYESVAQLEVRVIPVKFGSESKAALITALRIAMSGKEVKYPPDPPLMHELEDFGYSALPSGRIRYEAPKGKHDDWVTALALAWWGRRQGLGWQGEQEYGWVA